jgi:hypothetical protein
MSVVCATQKILFHVLTVATVVASKANEPTFPLQVGSAEVCVWWESRVRHSVLCFCVWQVSGFSRREKVFVFNLVYKEIL